MKAIETKSPQISEGMGLCVCICVCVCVCGGGGVDEGLGSYIKKKIKKTVSRMAA